MCGRVACGLASDVVRHFSPYMHSQTQESTVPLFIDLIPVTRSCRPSWNIAPTFTCLCLISLKHLNKTEDSSTRIVVCSVFKSVLNNCRSETIDEKPTFKISLRSDQRCVVLAEGFFEWKNRDDLK
ncbi:unnamed protein product [Rotaria socialis]|uniref:Abasic site processing protein HMCES n=1 Tax=Rotaria socialis TaxID=392032 RepID=A0A817U7U2_9BILA|nr:unnamed protein product [Rotaria socialis]CAF4205567.1 unnamed protein product [Rotaria socialis]